MAFVANTGQTLVSDAAVPFRGFIPRLFASMMRFSIWSLIPAVTAADAVRFQHHLNIIAEGFTVQGNRVTLLEADGHNFCRDLHALVTGASRP